MEPSVVRPPDEVFRELARKHFEMIDGLERIVWLRTGPDDELRLIEVNKETLPTQSVVAFRFAKTSDVPYACYIAEVTPEEWSEIRRGALPLPPDWSPDLSRVVELTPADVR